MALVTVQVNGKSYSIGCEDGAEAQLQILAGQVDAKAREIAAQAGGSGETRLMLLVALTLADELSSASMGAEEARAGAHARDLALAEAEDKAAAIIEAFALRVEKLGGDWGR